MTPREAFVKARTLAGRLRSAHRGDADYRAELRESFRCAKADLIEALDRVADREEVLEETKPRLVRGEEREGT